MKLLIKHLIRSIIKSPVQSIVIFLCVVFSALIFSCLEPIYTAIESERTFEYTQKYGMSDVCVSADISGDKMYVTLSDVKNKLPKNTVVTSFFVLPASNSDGALMAVALDFYTIQNMFDIHLTSSVPIPENELSNAIIISSDIAEMYSLSVGDEFVFKLLSSEKRYKIYGINEYRFFGEYDIIVHAPSALDELSSVSPVFSVFDQNNFPCSKIFIRGNAEEIVNSLSGIGLNVVISQNTGVFLDGLAFVILIALLTMSVVLGSVLLGFSLEILGRRRSAEFKLFCVAGVSEKTAFSAFCAEIFVYIALGGSAGILLGGAFLKFISKIFENSVPVLSKISVLITAVALIFVGCISLFIYRYMSSRDIRVKRKKVKKGFLSIALALFCVLSVLAFVVPISFRAFTSVAVFVIWVLLIIFGMKPLCHGISGLLSSNRLHLPVPLMLAGKNNLHIPELHNVYRILCITASVSMVLTSAVSNYDRRIKSVSEMFTCDCIVMGNGIEDVEKAEKLEGTVWAEKGFFAEATFEDGRPLYLVDAPQSAVAGETVPEKGISLSKNMAELYGLDIGDDVTFKISGKTYSLPLESYLNDGTAFVFANVDTLGLTDNVLLIRSDGSNSYISRLSAEFSMLGAVARETDSVFAPRMRAVKVMQSVLEAYTYIIILSVALGVINLVCVSYLRRKSEFRALNTLGAEKQAVGAVIICELLIALTVCTVLCLISGTLLSELLRVVVGTFGYSFGKN